MLLQEGGKVVCVILVYVDDLIMMGPAAEVDALCKQVSERFQCTVPVALSYSVTEIGEFAFYNSLFRITWSHFFTPLPKKKTSIENHL